MKDKTLEGMTVLVTDDEPMTRTLLARTLVRAGLRVIEATDGEEAWKALASRDLTIDAVLTDLEMPRMDGMDLLKSIRGEEQLEHLPVVVLTAHEEKEILLALYREGASDYLKKPFLKEELLARLRVHLRLVKLTHHLEMKIEEMKEMNRELERLALTDPLTQLPNRRHFMEKLAMEVYSRNRYGSSFSIIMLDIDHFKKVNDSLGHQTGDWVLQELAERVQSCLRRSDLPARVGGEEFAILLPNIPLEGAKVVAEKIRAHIADIPFLNDRNADPLNVSISLGVLNTQKGDELDEGGLYAKVDDHLYAAKKGGRNRVA